ncbi:GNAT family N-acetyltransferase [Amylibacter sp.]|nr:GNAT family N-acetyltransferase [Amylibacter sp.]
MLGTDLRGREMNLKKEKFLYSKNLILRDADETDAEFILKLRTDPIKSKFLSQTSASIKDQVAWIKSYKNRSDQAYFIIEDRASNKLGCIRIYNPTETSFDWGSWLIIEGAAPYVALESALSIYSYTRRLGFLTAKIDVRKDNLTVWKFHENIFGAVLVSETDLDRFYEVSTEEIDMRLQKYRKILISIDE